MPHQDSVLQAVLQQVPWSEFERLRVRHVLGTSANAVGAQLAAALLVSRLLRAAQT